MVLFFLPKPDDTTVVSSAESNSLIVSFSIFIAGCVCLPLGGHFLVTSAINLASQFGLSKAFIALFAVALGTSLPELATSVVAAKKGNTQLALGNILGSNIFNITLVLGISSLISPINIASIYKQDLILLGVMTLPLAYILLTTKKTHLYWGFCILMLLSYSSYCGFIYLR